MKHLEDAKRQLREQYLLKRRLLSPQDRVKLDNGLLGTILNSELVKATGILCYVSLESEPDTRSLISLALHLGIRVGVPRCVKNDGGLDFYEIFSNDDMAPGSFGIMEPDPAVSPKANPADFELCFVPGLSFDKNGNRLGYGKGYYDRFLKQYAGYTVGLCYSDFLAEELVHGPHDVPVKSILTERGVITVGTP